MLWHAMKKSDSMLQHAVKKKIFLNHATEYVQEKTPTDGENCNFVHIQMHIERLQTLRESEKSKLASPPPRVKVPTLRKNIKI